MAGWGERDRLALLSLWQVPMLGPVALARLAALVPGPPAAVLDLKVEEWVHQIGLPAKIRAQLLRVPRLATLGERVLERARRARMGIAFREDTTYPDQLRETEDAPPVLFYLGTPGPPRRRVALVGSREVDSDFLPWVERLASEVAAGGVGVVSGAAIGVDQAAHRGALAAGGETLAFLGSALDELDSAQRPLVRQFASGAGVLYSELPPRTRASKVTFPRRNRLISGAADATVVVRAREQSGALHTARSAWEQRRPLLAVPGDVRHAFAAGCNRLLVQEGVRACLGAKQIFEAVGVAGETQTRLARQAVDLGSLSPVARTALEAIARDPRTFDQIWEATRLESGTLTSALCELELAGLVVQRPGKLYERI